jgi:hypothetical protein
MSSALAQIKTEMGKSVPEMRREGLPGSQRNAKQSSRMRGSEYPRWVWLKYERVSTGGTSLKPLTPRIKKQLDELRWMTLEDTGAVAEVPNETSIDRAQEVLLAATRGDVQPLRVVPCADGGVTVIFDKFERFAVLDFFNTGEVVLARSSGPGTTTAVEVEWNKDSANWVAKELREFLT